jgi:molybdopterin-guanine dinucleotide biosynthesis protein A
MSAASEQLHVGGIVLCGGRSSRMGRPKHLLPFGEETLLERVVRLLGQAVSPVIVVAGPGQTLPTLPADVEIARDPQEHLGPLAGLATGLDAWPSSVEAIYLSGCDVPLLKPAFVGKLVAALGTADLVMPRDGDLYHPLAAVYRTRIRGTVQALLAAGRMRPYFLVEECQSKLIDVEELRDVDPQLDSLRNTNTAAEYQSALRAAGFSQPFDS